MRPTMRAISAGLLGMLLPLAAVSADYPTRPIRVIVPFTAGTTDIPARAVAEKLQARLGQSIIVDPKPGAGSIIGTDYVASAPADGYTLLFTSGVLTTLKTLNKDLKFDPEKSFEPISLVAEGYFTLAVPAALPVQNFAEFVAYAKSNPGKLNYVSLGRNSIMLMMEIMKAQAGIDVTPIPFSGMSPGRLALLRNDVQMILDGPVNLKPLADNGQVKLLMFTGPTRSPALPNVPTSTEAGLPDYTAGWFMALLAPAGTPKEVVALLSREVAAVTALPEIRKVFADQGGNAVGSTPDALAQRLQSEQKRYAEAARVARIQPE